MWPAARKPRARRQGPAAAAAMAAQEERGGGAGGACARKMERLQKTKLCRFQAAGICTKGPECRFAHGEGELEPLPDLARTKLCRTLLASGACALPGCTYAHSKEELRSTSNYHKTKLCRFSIAGHCVLGAKCNFAHSEEEVRGPAADGPPVLRPGLPPTVPPGTWAPPPRHLPSASRPRLPSPSSLSSLSGSYSEEPPPQEPPPGLEALSLAGRECWPGRGPSSAASSDDGAATAPLVGGGWAPHMPDCGPPPGADLAGPALPGDPAYVVLPALYSACGDYGTSLRGGMPNF